MMTAWPAGATAATPVPAPPPLLRCSLALAAPVPPSGPVRLRVTLHNAGRHTVQVLTWGTPFEAGWLAPWAELRFEGQALPYRGAQVKRGDAQAEEYLRIAAGRTRQGTVDLAEAFDLQRPGRYELHPRITLHDVLVGPTAQARPGPRPRAEHQALTLACPALHFTRPAR